MFTTDETIGSKPSRVFEDGIVKQPAHIRAIREERYKFAMYFDPEHAYDPLYRQYELYDLDDDPHELHNMADPANHDWYDRDKVREMEQKLAARMADTHTTPGGGPPGAPPA